MFLCFFNWPGDSKHLGSAGQQADKYIAPEGKFLMFFVSNFAYMNQVRRVHFLYLKPLVCIPFSTGAMMSVPY
jgi:hypothetical protein